MEEYGHLNQEQLLRALLSTRRRANNVDTRYGGYVPYGAHALTGHSAPYSKQKQKIMDEQAVIRGHLSKFEENPEDPF